MNKDYSTKLKEQFLIYVCAGAWSVPIVEVYLWLNGVNL